MKCPNCHKENKEGSSFCSHCGTPLPTQALSEKIQPKKNKTLWAAGIVTLAAIVAISSFFLYQHFANGAYPSLLAQAEDYAAKDNYREAETILLDAIDQQPQNQQAYLKLSQIYVNEKEEEKAQAILDQGFENQALTQLNDSNFNLYSYYLLKDQELPETAKPLVLDKGLSLYNDTLVQNSSDQQPLLMGEQWGLASQELIYTAKDWNQIMSIDNHYDIQADNELYQIEDGDQIPSDLSLPTPGLIYYCQDKIEKTDNNLAIDSVMPIPQTKSTFDGSDSSSETLQSWISEQASSWALTGPDGFVSEFDYDWICSQSEGLFAAKKGDYWGYLNERGEEVIPFELDASWNLNGLDLCYGFVHSIVPITKDSQWAMMDNKGNLIIPFGRFEEILPVDSNRQFYAKENGIWNHYELGDRAGIKEISKEDYEVLDTKLPDFVGTPLYVNNGFYLYQERTSESKGEHPLGAINYLGEVVREPVYIDRLEGRNDYVLVDMIEEYKGRPDVSESRQELEEKVYDNSDVDACIVDDSSSSGMDGTFLVSGESCQRFPGNLINEIDTRRIVTYSLEEEPIYIDNNDQRYTSIPENVRKYSFTTETPTYEVELIKDSEKEDLEYEVVNTYFYSELTKQYYEPYGFDNYDQYKEDYDPNKYPRNTFSSFENINDLPGAYEDTGMVNFAYAPNHIGEVQVIDTLAAVKNGEGASIFNAQTGEITEEVFDFAYPLSKKLFLVEQEGKVGLINEDFSICWIEGIEDISAVFDNHAFALIDGSWKLIEFKEPLF